MSQTTYIARKGEDADFTALTADSLTINSGGAGLTGGVLLGTSQVVDLNGEADALVIDADADTTISSPTDDQIDFEISGADDFRMVANVFRALSGSSIESDTINETTAAAGVTVDSLLIKDGGFVAAGVIDANGQEFILDADADTSITADTDDQIDIKISGADDFQLTANTLTALSGSIIKTNTIDETTGASGVTVDSFLIKDGGFVAAGVTDQNGLKLILDADADTSITADTDDQIDFELSGADDFRMTANTFTALAGSAIETNTINETTAANGVVIDSVTLKDGIVQAGSKLPVAVITGDGAITVTPGVVALTKGSAAAITIVAPTDVTHDGYTITVYSETAQAHVITCGTDGFNAKGSSGTLTLGGAKGDGATLLARNGHWWVVSKINATAA